MNIKQNLKKRPLLFRSEIGLFDISFKRLYGESFEDLQPIIIENFKPVPLCLIKTFVRLHKILLLIANIVKGAVSALRQFLTTESPWKLMKNVFYLILKALFVLKITKFFSWLFGHVEKNCLIRKKRLISTFMTSQPG